MLVHYQLIQSKNDVIIEKHNYDYKIDENSIHWKDHRTLDRKVYLFMGTKILINNTNLPTCVNNITQMKLWKKFIISKN